MRMGAAPKNCQPSRIEGGSDGCRVGIESSLLETASYRFIDATVSPCFSEAVLGSNSSFSFFAEY